MNELQAAIDKIQAALDELRSMMGNEEPDMQGPGQIEPPMIQKRGPQQNNFLKGMV